MGNYLARRTGQIILTLFLIVSVAFSWCKPSPETIRRSSPRTPTCRRKSAPKWQAAFGLDKSLGEQYLVHIKNSFTGQFGVSFQHYPRTVMEVITERVAPHGGAVPDRHRYLLLRGVRAGEADGLEAGRVIRVHATVSGAVLFTMFTPWFALMLIWIFSFQLGGSRWASSWTHCCGEMRR